MFRTYLLTLLRLIKLKLTKPNPSEKRKSWIWIFETLPCVPVDSSKHIPVFAITITSTNTKDCNIVMFGQDKDIEVIKVH